MPAIQPTSIAVSSYTNIYLHELGFSACSSRETSKIAADCCDVLQLTGTAMFHI
jgi:hypothetical protein